MKHEKKNDENDEKSRADAPKPTVGRIVHFHDDETPHAALVAAVNDDGTCTLAVFGCGVAFGGQVVVRREHVPFSELPRRDHWTWPPRA